MNDNRFKSTLQLIDRVIKLYEGTDAPILQIAEAAELEVAEAIGRLSVLQEAK